MREISQTARDYIPTKLSHAALQDYRSFEQSEGLRYSRYQSNMLSQQTSFMHIYSTDENLLEVESDLHKSGISTERYIIACNTADFGGTDVQVVSVAAGAAIALIAQVLAAFISRKAGQRKVVFRITDQDKDEIINIEVETPQLEEIETLLKKTYEVHLMNRNDNRKKIKKDTAAK